MVVDATSKHRGDGPAGAEGYRTASPSGLASSIASIAVVQPALAGTICGRKVNTLGSCGSTSALTQWVLADPKVSTRVKLASTLPDGDSSGLVDLEVVAVAVDQHHLPAKAERLLAQIVDHCGVPVRAAGIGEVLLRAYWPPSLDSRARASVRWPRLRLVAVNNRRS